MTTDFMLPEFDVRTIPFSRRGSWFDISPITGLRRTSDRLHLVSHQTDMHPVLTIDALSHGLVATTTWTATPARLTMSAATGVIEIVYENPTTIRLRGSGVGVALRLADGELTPFSGAYFFGDPLTGSPTATVYETGRRYRVTVLDGAAKTHGLEALGVAERGITIDGDSWEVAVEEGDTAFAPYVSSGTFDKLVAAAGEDFRHYLNDIAPWRTGDASAAALAAYVMWSATVRPSGFITRESVLMSKHWMDSVWSWDHCFNALALVGGLPDHGWDQLLMPFDHLDVTGALPDSVAHSRVLRNFVKPPIHGWTLDRMLEHSTPPEAQLAEIYDALQSWTFWWLTYRTMPAHGTPFYEHGNDSGWDNSTVFDSARVVESADLAAFMVLQMRCLAALAQRLSRVADVQRWSSAADDMQARLIERFWNGRRFVARNAHTDEQLESDSLLACMPIVLGDKLPPVIISALTDQIERHLTDHGLATEPVDSTNYEDDGYWRGPIWAPPTVLIVDGLRRAGRTQLADTIATRYLRLCESHGFAENFDARTGEGLRDRAYTWTASAYLVLAAQRGDAASTHHR